MNKDYYARDEHQTCMDEYDNTVAYRYAAFGRGRRNRLPPR